LGWVDGDEFRLQQIWGKKSSHSGEVANVWGVIVGEDCVELSYACRLQKGKLKTGTNRFKRVKTSNILQNVDNLPELYDGKAIFCPPDIDDKWHKANFDESVYKKLKGWKFFAEDEGFSHTPLYDANMSILVLGEADFSFTCGFARRFNAQRPGSCTNLVGSSYMLKQGYGPMPQVGTVNFDPKKRQFLNEQTGVTWILTELVYHQGAHVRFGVDARNITQTLRQGQNRPEADVLPKKFDRIIFPFPRSSLRKFSKSQDTDLIGGTLRSAQQELAPDGELHMILHTSKAGLNQFDLWGVRELAEATGMVWRATLPFDWHLIPPYHPKDVTGQNWNPFEPLVVVFTPKAKSKNDHRWTWKVGDRRWRPNPQEEEFLSHNIRTCPERGTYSNVAQFQQRRNDIMI